MHGTVQGLPDSIAVNNVSWKKIYDSLEPDHAPLPEPWRSELSPLQKIVTLRTLRPDKLIPALTTFVADSLGRRFVEPKPFAIEPSYNDSTCNTPLIFVLSPGRYGNPRVLGGCLHGSQDGWTGYVVQCIQSLLGHMSLLPVVWYVLQLGITPEILPCAEQVKHTSGHQNRATHGAVSIHLDKVVGLTH